MTQTESVYDKVMAELVINQQKSYRPEATTRPMPKGKMTVINRKYQPNQNNTVILAKGPAKKDSGQYTLSIDHDEKKVFHAYGEPSKQKGRGVVTDIEIPT